MGRVFANGLGVLGSILGRVIPKTLKMVLDTSLFNPQQYKVRIKGKVGQSRERSSTLLRKLKSLLCEKQQQQQQQKFNIRGRALICEPKNIQIIFKWRQSSRLGLQNTPKFVDSSYQTGLDTRSMTRRSIKVGIRGAKGRARAETTVRVTMMHLTHPKVAQLNLKSAFARQGLLPNQCGLQNTPPASL